MTTFIKTECIADGYGRANVPRIGGLRNGIQNGRRVDDEVRQWVDSGLKIPLKLAGSRRVAAGLHKLGIRPLKAQVRVTDVDSRLTTLIDVVGESIIDSNVLWVVEVKATTLKTENHNTSYSRQCRRTPVMRNGVAHTEQATHFLQAAFGALAIQKCYALPSQMIVKACVVVATTDACRAYVCPAKFFKWALFKRRSPVPVTMIKKPSAKQLRKTLKRSPAARQTAHSVRWPSRVSALGKALEAALHRVGLVRKIGASVTTAIVQVVHQKKLGVKSPPIGVVLLIEQPLHKLSPEHRKLVATKLEKSAKLLLKRWTMVRAAARLVLCTSTKTLAPCPGPLVRP